MPELLPVFAPRNPNSSTRADWSRWSEAEIGRIYRLPLLALIEQAHAVHRQAHPEPEVQLCHLLSIKTGGCPEDCAYCPQSARHEGGVEAEKLLDSGEVLAAAQRARDAGSTRFCMGAAWRQVKEGPEFDRVLGMVRGVADLGLEVCCTLGMLNAGQAERLAAAGLTAYNHNLDTSPEYYGNIITTRTYEDRLRTLEHVREAGISVCCGGILGMGESEQDRIRLLGVLANMPVPPESVPINALVAVEGTPLAGQKPIDAFEFVRAVATARILMPQSKVRLSAGRLTLSAEAQALCFYAGANSIFVGDKLLTTPNPDFDHDHALLQTLGLEPEPPLPGRMAAVPASAVNLEAELAAELAGLERQARRRSLVAATGEDFCSNDYLGLATHPAIAAALRRGLEAGLETGATGSRLVRGNHGAFVELEARFARLRGTAAALLFSSGYAANCALLGALARRQDVIFSDALNHASLIDGMRLSGAERVVVPHLDMTALARLLRRHAAQPGQRRFYVVESLYSMDGDRAPLAEITALCREHHVGLIVDEAHATGIFGPGGAGLVAELVAGKGAAAAAAVVATVHPCGKALGAAGAFVAASQVVCDTVINRGRGFIFSTAPSPLLAAQLDAALDVLAAEPGRAVEVRRLARELRRLLAAAGVTALGAAEAPMVPVVMGEAAAAVAAAQRLQAAGWDVRAIRPPTVAAGTARLRLTVHTGQTTAALERLAAAVAAAVADGALVAAN